MTLSTIIEEAKKLTPEEQDKLVAAMLRQSRDSSTELELTAAQAADLDMRIEEYRAGNAEMIDGEEFLKQLRKKYL